VADEPKRWERFLDQRIGYVTLREFTRKQLNKSLPPRTGWLHVFGTVALVTLAIQFVTGMLLLLHYRPTVAAAHDSIRHITANVPFGWLIRQAHAWGASLLVFMLILHMARTFFCGSFKKPRELTWLFGVMIFFATLLFGFTGYLLPWNQRAYWATTVSTEVTGSVPVVGETAKQLLLGGTSVEQETLSRFFLLHVILLPWLLAGLVTVHLILVRVHGVATLEDVGKEKPFAPAKGIPFWPVHVAKEWAASLVGMGVLFTLAVLHPHPIGEPANLMETPEAIKPEWYFLPIYQLLKYFTGSMGKVLGIVVAMIPFALLILCPFLDRSPARRPGRRPVVVAIGVACIVLTLFLGVLGYLSETRQTILGRTFEFDVYGVPHVIESAASGPDDGPARL
jgi:quinol-cytochrome oxidoreductase complex cytochrome b subunit